MILDAQLVFTGTGLSIDDDTYSSDYIDLGAAARADEFKVRFHFTALGGTGSPATTIEVYGDSDSGFGTQQMLASRTIANADRATNKNYWVDVPPTGAYRYLRIRFTQTGTTPTGTAHAELVSEKLTQKSVNLAGNIPSV